MQNRYVGIDEFVVKVINKEVAKLQGRYGITKDDLDDLAQDLHVQVWRKLTGACPPNHPQYRAAVRRTVDTRIKDIIDHRKAAKRSGERDALRLDAPIENDEGEPHTYEDVHDLEPFLGAAPAWHRHRHEKMDADTALSRLPQDLRRLADTIEALDGNLSAVERDLGVTRKKLRCDLAKLRELLRHLRAE